jgi:GTP-binding protein HflX
VSYAGGGAPPAGPPAARTKARLPIVAIVGYTNAGKSTLLNTLTHSEVLAEDKLFATLDPTTRRLRFPYEREIILADTVGFIRDLPRDLAQAFRATLEELDEADLLLHVVDAADPARAQQTAAVETILTDLGLAETPRLVVLNKMDLVPVEEREGVLREARVDGGRPAVGISAQDAPSTEPLLAAVERALWQGGNLPRAEVVAS